VAGVQAFLAACGEAEPTPLIALRELAKSAGVGSLHVKDEAGRMGLGSFKALGGSYAVFALVLEEAGRRLGRAVGFEEALRPEVHAVAQTMTVGCATDGNHGRAVAAGAQRIGARAAIFVHERVSPGRIAAIAAFGAQMIRVPGAYDDAVDEAARRCEAEGWLLVSDTTSPGYERVPMLVMQGYTALVHEALEQLSEPPTHVFVQAGVGGLAAAVAGHLDGVLGAARPTFVVVEPARAACVLECALAGGPVRIAEGEPTVMAMLECGETSRVAWRVLSRAADAFMTVEEGEAIAMMKRLAKPTGGDAPIVAGESGGVGVAGLLRAAADPQMRAALGLTEASRVLAINTEGATDPERYRLLVGRQPAVAY
jgi:diaminopropionate ammonia-lyase